MRLVNPITKETTSLVNELILEIKEEKSQTEESVGKTLTELERSFSTLRSKDRQLQETQACNDHLQAELVQHSDAHTTAIGDVPDDIAHRLDELDTERFELENELELVRRRAVELFESLKNSERGFDLERQRLAEEVS